MICHVARANKDDVDIAVAAASVRGGGGQCEGVGEGSVRGGGGQCEGWGRAV